MGYGERGVNLCEAGLQAEMERVPVCVCVCVCVCVVRLIYICNTCKCERGVSWLVNLQWFMWVCTCEKGRFR